MWAVDRYYVSERVFLGSELPTEIADEIAEEVSTLGRRVSALDEFSNGLLSLQFPTAGELVKVIHEVDGGVAVNPNLVSLHTNLAIEQYEAWRVLSERVTNDTATKRAEQSPNKCDELDENP